MRRRFKRTNIQSVFNYGKSRWKKQSTRMKGLRKEYSKLRRKAKKTLTQIERKYPQSDISRNTYFPTLAELSDSQIYGAIAKVNQFLGSQSSTLSGYEKSRQQTIRAFNDAGYTNINESNVDLAISFMEDWRAKYQSQINVPSEYVLKVWEQAQRLKLSKDDLIKNMDYYAQHLKQLKNTKPIKGKGNKKFSRADYKFKMGKAWKRKK